MGAPPLPLTESSFDTWEEEAIHETADSFFDGLLAELASALKTIDLEMYIFENDALGERVVESLAAAARRGVRVRVLVDGIGSPAWSAGSGRLLAASGVEARIYHPLPWSLAGRTKLWSHPGRFLRFLSNMNRRDHRKMCVIDGKAAWLGSMNVSVRSLNSVKGAKAWHECGVRVAGREVEVFVTVFEYAWDRVLDPFVRFTEGAKNTRRVAVFREARLVRVNSPIYIRVRNSRDLLMKIRAARRRVWLETPYFIPSLRLVMALRAAALSGADVRLILSAQSDIFFIPWIVPVIIERLLHRRLRVFAYTATTLHAKIMMIDDWVTVGSSNLNRRSLIHDLEVDAVMTSPASLDILQERFERDFERSVEMTAMTLKARSWWLKLKGRFLMPLRHWM